MTPRRAPPPPARTPARWDARLLLAHSMGGLSPLSLEPRATLDPLVEARFERMWEKRLMGVPVQHLIGEWDFYGRPFRVDGRALVPRPETEILVEQALREAPDAVRVLDAGTGSGIIAITYLLERPAGDGRRPGHLARRARPGPPERTRARRPGTPAAWSPRTGSRRWARRPGSTWSSRIPPTSPWARRRTFPRRSATTTRGAPCSPATTASPRSGSCWPRSRRFSNRAGCSSSRSDSGSPRPCAPRFWPARSGGF